MMKAMPEPQPLNVRVRLEDDVYWATVDEFPGVFATGDNLDELRESLAERDRSGSRPSGRRAAQGHPGATATRACRHGGQL